MLDSAVRLFGERGASQTSVREVGKAAGVTLATVHHHFGTKADLHRACVDAMYAELRTLEGELVPLFTRPKATTAETLNEVAVTAFRFARRHRAANRLVVREVLDAGGELPEDIRQTYLLPFLDGGSDLLAQAAGIPQLQARLTLQSVTYLIARYALNSDRELIAVTGAPDIESALRLLEDHIARSARALVGLDAGPIDKEMP